MPAKCSNVVGIKEPPVILAAYFIYLSSVPFYLPPFHFFFLFSFVQLATSWTLSFFLFLLPSLIIISARRILKNKLFLTGVGEKSISSKDLNYFCVCSFLGLRRPKQKFLHGCWPIWQGLKPNSNLATSMLWQRTRKTLPSACLDENDSVIDKSFGCILHSIRPQGQHQRLCITNVLFSLRRRRLQLAGLVSIVLQCLPATLNPVLAQKLLTAYPVCLKASVRHLRVLLNVCVCVCDF